jgi:uncharacterized membrane protein
MGNEMVDRGFDGARGVEGFGFVGLVKRVEVPIPESGLPLEAVFLRAI